MRKSRKLWLEARHKTNVFCNHEPENVVADWLLFDVYVRKQLKQMLVAMPIEFALKIRMELSKVVQRGKPHDHAAKLRRIGVEERGKSREALRKAFQQNIRDGGHVQQMVDEGMGLRCSVYCFAGLRPE